MELARRLASVHVAMADAGGAIWGSKYYYEMWRPITAIREADPGTGPTGVGDGNFLTIGDLTFSPLGAPASNLQGPNFPPLPHLPIWARRVRWSALPDVAQLISLSTSSE
jgi:hypothetical protein